MTEQNWIIGDCMEFLPRIPTGSVDLIISDLPYQHTQNSWDSSIPLEPLWREYKRITKENAAILLFGQGRFTGQLMDSNPDMWRYNLIWGKDRPTGFLNAAIMPLRSHEDICVFYQNPPTYNPQFWEGKPMHGMGTKFRKGGSQTSNYGKYDISKNPTAARAGDTMKYPRSVLHFAKPHPAVHPTQKPLALVEIGKYYKNVPTGRICKVTGKIFFNIVYDELDDVYHTNPNYCHYKSFRKHWIEVPDPDGD